MSYKLIVVASAVVALAAGALLWRGCTPPAPGEPEVAREAVALDSSEPPFSSVAAGGAGFITPEDYSKSPVFSPVKDLPKEAVYVQEGMCAVITSRTAAMEHEKPWGKPFPYQLQIVGEDTLYVDCGFFPAIHEDGFRTAYCLSGEDRVPERLYIRQETDGKFEFIVGSTTYGTFSPGKCAGPLESVLSEVPSGSTSAQAE